MTGSNRLLLSRGLSPLAKPSSWLPLVPPHCSSTRFIALRPPKGSLLAWSMTRLTTCAWAWENGWTGGELHGPSLRPWTQARCPPKLLSAEPLPRPQGTSSYKRPIVFLQAMNCTAGGSRWQRVAWGAPQRPVTMALGKLEQLRVWEKSMPGYRLPSRLLGHLVLVLFRATHPFVASLVNKHTLGVRHPSDPGRIKNSLTWGFWKPVLQTAWDFLKQQLPLQTAGSKSKAF